MRFTTGYSLSACAPKARVGEATSAARSQEPAYSPDTSNGRRKTTPLPQQLLQRG